MGLKLLAAFGAGALVAATAFLLFRPSEPVLSSTAAEPEPAPQVVAVFPDHVPTPPAKPAGRSSVKPQKARTFRKVAAVRKPLPPIATPISLPPAEVAEVPAVPPAPIALENDAPPPEPRTVTLAAGTLLQVRLNERLASDRNVIGDAFSASLAQPLVIDGYVIAEKGARVLGRIADLIPAGRVEGVAQMALELSSIMTADGQKVNLRTARFVRKGDTSRRTDAVKVGAGAAIGAVIGAIAGGGKGAAIGAAAGGGAGTAAVLATRGKAAVLDAETRLSFRLDSPVTITER